MNAVLVILTILALCIGTSFCALVYIAWHIMKAQEDTNQRLQDIDNTMKES